MSNGKGDKRRPRFISDEEYEANWERNFGSIEKRLIHHSMEQAVDIAGHSRSDLDNSKDTR